MTVIHLLIAGLCLQILLLNVNLGAGILVAYLVRPVLWGLLALLVFRMPRERPAGNSRAVRVLKLVGLFAAVIQVSVSVMFGLMEGFGRSPYSTSFTGALLNIWLVGTEVAGMEMCRAHLVNRCGRRRRMSVTIPVSLAFLLYSLTVRRMASLSDKVAVVRFLGEEALPGLSQSVFCSVLAFLGGPVAAMGYRVLLMGFWRLCPVLPDLSWGVAALIGTVVPILGVFIAQAEHAATVRPRRIPRDAGKAIRSTLVVAVIGMVFMWFAYGLFPVYPSVVLTGSMRPYLNPGDLIVSIKNTGSIREGDVIEFRRDDMWVAHRVLEVRRAGNHRFFVTKGDANAIADQDLVTTSMVKGKVLTTVPGLGRVSIALRKLIFR